MRATDSLVKKFPDIFSQDTAERKHMVKVKAGNFNQYQNQKILKRI
jgi:hypothetical protein